MEVLTGSISTYVFSVVRSRPSFLLLYRAPQLPHADTWQAVHGMIEPGEKATAAARREMIEETGLAPDRFFKTDFVETFYSETTDAVHLVPAFAAFVEGAPAAHALGGAHGVGVVHAGRSRPALRLAVAAAGRARHRRCRRRGGRTSASESPSSNRTEVES